MSMPPNPYAKASDGSLPDMNPTQAPISPHDAMPAQPEPAVPRLEASAGLTLLIALAGAIPGCLLYWSMASGQQLFGLFVIGPIIGLALRLFANPPHRNLGWICVGVGFFVPLAVFMLVDTTLYTPYIQEETLKRTFNLQTLLCVFGTSQLAYFVVTFER